MTPFTTRILTLVAAAGLIGSLILVALFGIPALQDVLTLPGQSIVYVQPTPSVAGDTGASDAPGTSQPADTDSPVTATASVAATQSNPATATPLPPTTATPAIDLSVSAPLRACDTTQFPALSDADREFFDRVNGATAARSNAETQFRLQFSASAGADSIVLDVDGRYQSQITPGTPNFGLTATARIEQNGVAAGEAQIDLRLIEDMIYFRVNLPDGLIPWYGISYNDLVASGTGASDVPDLETLLDTFDPNATADTESPLIDPYQFVYTTRRPDFGDTASFDSCIDLLHILTLPETARLVSLSLQEQEALPPGQNLTPDQIAQLLAANVPQLSITVTHTINIPAEQVEQLDINGEVQINGVVADQSGQPVATRLDVTGQFTPATYDTADLIVAPPIEQTFIIEDVEQLTGSLSAP